MVSTASAPERSTRHRGCNEDHAGSWRGCTVCRGPVRRMEEGRNPISSPGWPRPLLTLKPRQEPAEQLNGFGILRCGAHDVLAERGTAASVIFDRRAAQGYDADGEPAQRHDANGESTER